MEPIRVVWGTATALTAMGSYDGALAAAGIENYNLVQVSSVVPAGASVAAVGTAPDLGPAGERLTVVEARATVAPDEAGPACAGLGWALEESGRGIFYEASGTEPDAVRDAVREGRATGERLREWSFSARDERFATLEAPDDAHTTAVVAAVYGSSEPLL